jgi:hypothetical protein
MAQIPINQTSLFIPISIASFFMVSRSQILTPKLCAWILLDFFSVREDKRKEEIQKGATLLPIWNTILLLDPLFKILINNRMVFKIAPCPSQTFLFYF